LPIGKSAIREKGKAVGYAQVMIQTVLIQAGSKVNLADEPGEKPCFQAYFSRRILLVMEISHIKKKLFMTKIYVTNDKP
jgi:hypothetical protein